MKKYRLLKDTPESKAGTIFEYREEQKFKLIGDRVLTTPAGYYPDYFVFEGQSCFKFFQKDIIESKSEWFEEVVEGIELTERQVKILSMLENFIDLFSVNKEKGSISINRDLMHRSILSLDSFIEKESFKINGAKLNLADFMDSKTGAIDIKNLSTDEAKVWEIIKIALQKKNRAPVHFDHSKEKDKTAFTVITADGHKCTDGDTIYGIAIQASGVDQWREQKLPFKTPINESRVWFKDKEKANEYLIGNKKCLSLTDILNIQNSIIKTHDKGGQKVLVELLNNVIKSLTFLVKDRI